MSGFIHLAGVYYPLALARCGDAYMLVEQGVGQGVITEMISGVISEDGGAVVATHGQHIWVHLDGRTYDLVWQDPVSHYSEESGADHASASRAPMPGAVVSVCVAAGDTVAAGDALLIIESMKLESVIRAPRDGVVAAVHVGAGQVFERDALLVSLEEATS